MLEKMYIVLWIFGFFLLVVLHEFWHFVAARFFKVKVHEFGIWIPPKIWTLYEDKKWTKYTLNLLPIWWFIRPKWEDISNEKEIYDPDSFHSKNLFQKIIILLWWVFMNFLIAFIIFTTVFYIWVKPLRIIPDSIYNFSAQSYLFPTTSFAEEIGYIKNEKKWVKVTWVIQKTDIKKEDLEKAKNSILSLQIPIKTWDVINYIWAEKVSDVNVSKVIKKYIWKKIKVWILRDNKQLYFTWTCGKENCLLWIYHNFPKTYPVSMSLWKAMETALKEMKAETILTFEAFGHLYNKLKQGKVKEATDRLSWPVGAVAVWRHILEIWFVEYFAFLWMISLALAIFNVLPIPALDGGRIFTTSIMHIFRLQPKKYLDLENKINIAFFLVLMVFWFYVMWLDISRIYNKEI